MLSVIDKILSLVLRFLNKVEKEKMEKAHEEIDNNPRDVFNDKFGVRDDERARTMPSDKTEPRKD